MDRVEEIEAVIVGLPPEEFRRLARWFRAREHARWFWAREQAQWDGQLDSDPAAGRLDFIFDEVESESSEGLVREWPPRK